MDPLVCAALKPYLIGFLLCDALKPLLIGFLCALVATALVFGLMCPRGSMDLLANVGSRLSNYFYHFVNTCRVAFNFLATGFHLIYNPIMAGCRALFVVAVEWSLGLIWAYSILATVCLGLLALVLLKDMVIVPALTFVWSRLVSVLTFIWPRLVSVFTFVWPLVVSIHPWVLVGVGIVFVMILLMVCEHCAMHGRWDLIFTNSARWRFVPIPADLLPDGPNARAEYVQEEADFEQAFARLTQGGEEGPTHLILEGGTVVMVRHAEEGG